MLTVDEMIDEILSHPKAEECLASVRKGRRTLPHAVNLLLDDFMDDSYDDKFQRTVFTDVYDCFEEELC